MNYYFSKRDGANRATLTINGKKVGRVHFRGDDAWLNPYLKDTIKSRDELKKLGMELEQDPLNNSFPIKICVKSSNEAEIASLLSQAFYEL